jgi:hypothetical protein
MAANLFLGLARHPREWPWSYLMLLGYALLFLATHPGRILGLDGLLRRRLSAPMVAERTWARTLAIVT